METTKTDIRVNVCPRDEGDFGCVRIGGEKREEDKEIKACEELAMAIRIRCSDLLPTYGNKGVSVVYDTEYVDYVNRADAILGELELGDETLNIIDDMQPLFFIRCSSKPNDTSNENTDRTRYSGKTVREIIEIVNCQPYIHCLSGMNKQQEQAIHKVAEKIIVAKQSLKKEI